MDIRNGSLTIDDLTSPYLEAGSPDSPEAVIHVHGGPGCSQEFKRLVEETGAFARAVAIDMPGLGRADKPSPKQFIYDVPNLGVHLANQLEALGVNSPGSKRTLKELPVEDRDVMWRSFDRPTRRAILALYRATDIETQTANLPQMRLLVSNWPSIVIFGADDPDLPTKFAERNKESLPNATIHMIEGACHWPHWKSPKRSARLCFRSCASRLARRSPSSC